MLKLDRTTAAGTGPIRSHVTMMLLYGSYEIMQPMNMHLRTTRLYYVRSMPATTYLH